MTSKPTGSEVSAAVAVARDLLAAGWRYTTRTPLADDDTIRDLTHPDGGVIAARTSADGTRTELTLAPLSLAQVAGAIRGAGLVDTPAEQPPAVYVVDFASGVPHSQRPGMVAGLCGHAVAPSDWRAGLRTCERCPAISSPLVALLPAIRPIEIPAGGGLDAHDLAEEIYVRIQDLLDQVDLALDVEPIDVEVELAWGEARVFCDDEGLVLARGVITGPGVGGAR
jgi:hypothetical protein